ncbi:MAG: UbiX family flavin prenyltransferase [Bacteroidetes bacterium]|nr:UbiX family flavin prenyltransferase [Bacteroidota bacterium]
METNSKPLIIALTGATGSIYGLTLARKVLEAGISIHLLISKSGQSIVEHETDRSWNDWLADLREIGSIETPDIDNLGASISSGSYPTCGMVIAPCSMGALGRIASGISGNLIERAADVCLKERRQLVLLARETPLSAIHLQNMLTVTQAGGIIMPPVPAFYTKPKQISELVEHTVDRVLALLGVVNTKAFQWNPGNGDA